MPLGTSLRMALRLLRPVVGPMLTYSKNPPYSSFTVLPIKYVYLLFSQREAASRFISLLFYVWVVNLGDNFKVNFDAFRRKVLVTPLKTISEALI